MPDNKVPKTPSRPTTGATPSETAHKKRPNISRFLSAVPPKKRQATATPAHTVLKNRLSELRDTLEFTKVIENNDSNPVQGLINKNKKIHNVIFIVYGFVADLNKAITPECIKEQKLKNFEELRKNLLSLKKTVSVLIKKRIIGPLDETRLTDDKPENITQDNIKKISKDLYILFYGWTNKKTGVKTDGALSKLDTKNADHQTTKTESKEALAEFEKSYSAYTELPENQLINNALLGFSSLLYRNVGTSPFKDILDIYSEDTSKEDYAESHWGHIYMRKDLALFQKLEACLQKYFSKKHIDQYMADLAIAVKAKKPYDQQPILDAISAMTGDLSLIINESIKQDKSLLASQPVKR